MKQNQRDALTKEKQVYLATGGGPPPAATNIDPDIASITPHLMETAPVLFSSNMTENEIDSEYISECIYNQIKNNEDDILNALKDGTMSILCGNYNDTELKIQEAGIINKINKNEVIEENKENQNVHESNLMFPIKRKENWDMSGMQTSKLMKEKKTVHTFTNEDDIKIQRIKYIIDQEKEMADVRKANEEKFSKMKEELHAVEMRAALAKLNLQSYSCKTKKRDLKRLMHIILYLCRCIKRLIET